jgi:hypothetical protein
LKAYHLYNFINPKAVNHGQNVICYDIKLKNLYKINLKGCVVKHKRYSF